MFPVGFLRSRWPAEVTVLKVCRRGPHPLREMAQASPSPLNATVSTYTELSPSPPHPSSSVPALGTRVPLECTPTGSTHGFSQRDPTNQSPLDDGPCSTLPVPAPSPPGPGTAGVLSDPPPCASRVRAPAGSGLPLPHGDQLSPNPSPGKTPSLGSRLWMDGL